ncbi:alcohol dehydrogenase [Sphingomonas sp. Root710]|uniref:PQQ-dependent dehydrogenase, methanol/ethanol family n=1 Tax=Sphingomonas sp. Root710 TaxID=1736594 RepID=UPI000701D594|nr:alcohol dehydrogenase [Sphingomonas sp. Root710]
MAKHQFARPLAVAGITLLAAGVVSGAAAVQKKNVEARGERPVSAQRIIDAPHAEPGSWLTPGLTYGEDRFSQLTSINTANVGKLGLAWFYDLPVDRGQEATPLMIDGVLYFSTAWSMVIAVDARTGKHLWTYDPEVPRETGFKACCDVVNRGVAAWGNKIFVGTIDGRLVAIDRKTGKKVWSVVTVDQSQPYTITGAPRVVKGKVIIGNGGAEYGVRGYVTAYDADTGRQDWRFYTVPGDPSKGFEAPYLAEAAKTWTGKWWENGGGGTVWDSMAYDPALNLLYIGVGNGSPWRRDIRSPGGGDNLFLSSIVAINPDTGAYVWHYQTTPGDDWDFTATSQMILADLTIEGKVRQVIMQAPKNGFFYVLDRKTGQLISAKNFVPQTWTTGIDMKTGRPIEAPGARYEPGKPFLMRPSAFAAHNWHPMSFNRSTGLVYIPVMDIPVKYVVDEKYKRRPGTWNLGVDFSAAAIPDDFDERKKVKKLLQGRLLAWDPVHQRKVWSVEHANPANGGVVSTAGNLVFQGTADGRFVAYHAQTGKKLWEFPTQMGIVAPPISYAVGGRQYVSVLVGWGAGYALASAFNDPSVGSRFAPRRLLTFALGATGKLPKPVKEELTRVDLSPASKWTAQQIEDGRKAYSLNCSFCHSEAAVGNHVLPDLRYSAAIGSEETFRQIVIDGLLKDNGMASFSRYLSAEDAENIRGYISKEARRFWEYQDKQSGKAR